MDVIDQYLNAFVHKDIDTISRLFTDDVILTDPFVKTVAGKDNVLAIYRDLFDGKTFELDCLTRTHNESHEVSQEFILKIMENKNQTIVKGVDIFVLQAQRIKEIRAYVYVE